jgi:hypothetical protein
MNYALNKETLYSIAEYTITGLVLIFGLKYLKEIVEIVFTELYVYFIQGQRPFAL